MYFIIFQLFSFKYSCLNFKANDHLIKEHRRKNYNFKNGVNQTNKFQTWGYGVNQAETFSTWENAIIKHNKFSTWVYYFILNIYSSIDIQNL